MVNKILHKKDPKTNNGQQNTTQKRDPKTNNGQQNTTQKSKGWATGIPWVNGGELGCSGWVAVPASQVAPVVLLLFKKSGANDFKAIHKPWAMVSSKFCRLYVTYVAYIVETCYIKVWNS